MNKRVTAPTTAGRSVGGALRVANVKRRLPVGAEIVPGGVHFRVWAPKHREAAVVIEGRDPFEAPLEPEGQGYFSALVAGVGAKARYRYRLGDREAFPDLASRFQPEGPHGSSCVVDPTAFAWSDDGWPGIALEGQVLYELHIGTFTEEGTWAAAMERLPALADLGITAIEVMPVNEFAGEFGWGYDGVGMYAPYHVYGSPEDMRRFVDRAHSLGLGVLLDVVYNHLGPDGAYHREYSDEYYHAVQGKNEWGDSLNLDGADGLPVREFFVANAAYWIDEFHLDGLRFDATQAIHDSSPRHILADMTDAARCAARGRSILLVGENEPQDVRLLAPTSEGGHGLDGLWNDDFHHAALVALTGRTEAYYTDYCGTPQELISAIRRGFLFQGQFCHWQQKLRGTPTDGITAARFISFLENHDQVANSVRSARLIELTSASRYRALATAWLLAPQTPMFFQGQEYGSRRPFTYFADHRGELGRMVKEGRASFLSQFVSANDPDSRAAVPEPSGRSTFERAKLEPTGDETERWFREFFRDLLALRRDDRVFRAQRADRVDGAVLGPEAFALRFRGEDAEARLIIVNLGRDIYPLTSPDPSLAPPAGCAWSVRFSSENPRYDGSGTPPFDPEGEWRIAGHCAVVLEATKKIAKTGEGPPIPPYVTKAQDVHPDVRVKAEQIVPPKSPHAE